MLTIRSDKYWIDRSDNLFEEMYKKDKKLLAETKHLFDKTNKNMEKQIAEFYSKYGKSQTAPVFKTLSDGTKVISGYNSKVIVSAADASKNYRINKLQKSLSNVLNVNAVNQNKTMEKELIELGKEMYNKTNYEIAKGINLGTSFNLFTDTQAMALIKNPVHGQDFSKRIWTNRDKLANAVNQTLADGIAKGLTNKHMANEIAGIMNSGESVSNRLIRTEVTNTLNQSSKLSYERSEIVDQYKYLATLDNKTSDICQELDGQIFNVKDAQAGLNMPPMHPNCRSTTVAEFPNEKEILTRIAKTDKRYFTVPDNMHYKDFKKIYIDKTMTRKSWDKLH